MASVVIGHGTATVGFEYQICRKGLPKFALPEPEVNFEYTTRLGSVP